MRDLIIIGAGPAGISAGIYAAWQQLDTLIVSKEIGGQIATKAVPIENYPGLKEIPSTDLIGRLQQHLEKFDVEIKMEEVNEINKQDSHFIIQTDKEELEAKSVIIATGADPRPLEVPGEKKLIGQGVSYCAVCDGPVYKGEEVVVAGGGNAGFETALFLSKYVKHVTILEFLPEVKADKINQQRIERKDSVEVITNAELKEIKGEEFVESVVYEDRESEEEKELEVKAIFIEIGRQPATAFVNDLVEFNEEDEIIVDRDNGATKTEGLFAAGDVTNVKFKQIVIAAGQGAKAALGVHQYLQNE
ncbi:MAG: FAD-dependent oxidoreductase [Candidatus Paceibacterota bacterium]